MHDPGGAAGGGMAEGAARRGVSVEIDTDCEAILRIVARERRVPVRLLLHRSRCRANTASARQLAMYLMHTTLGRSLVEVGAVFRRDRTTVSHACARIEDQRDCQKFDAAVERLEAAILAATGGGDGR